MTRLVRSARADEDLIDIWSYVASDDPAAADRLLDRLEDVLGKLAASPEMGVDRSDILSELRLFPVRDYLILFRRIPSGIEIVRVIHGARKWQDLL